MDKATAERIKEGEVDKIWQEFKQTSRKASELVLGRTKSGRKEPKESWWWNEEVKQALKQKLVFKLNYVNACRRRI